VRTARLAHVALPTIDSPVIEPDLDPALYRRRRDCLIGRMGACGLDYLILYADREHSANLAWLTGFDPRFEEALLVVERASTPILFTGPENQGPAHSAPLALDVRLHPSLGLMGQERSGTRPLAELLAQCGIGPGAVVAIAGWKYFETQEHAEPDACIESPAYIVDALRQLTGSAGRLINGGQLLMHPLDGLRAVSEVDQLARFEFAACHTSDAVRRVVTATRPGMREFEAAVNLRQIALPQSCHPMLSSGKRAWHGLFSPSSRVMQRGDPVTVAYGVRGALNCRAGWLAHDEGDLREPVRDYVDRLVNPYFSAIAQWLENVAIGVPGGRLDEIIRSRLGDRFFGVALNPGHLIHLDEWMHSPIVPGGTGKLASGMALQVDVIPATGGPYFTTNVEDGIALLDERGRGEFREKYPDAWMRIEQRRAFMADELGIVVQPDVLPFSNIAGWLPPFWLAPDRAMVMG
jgi:hypothetical protein